MQKRRMNGKEQREINKRISNNVRFLCKRKGIKIGDLEKEINISRGYFARVSRSPQEIGVSKLIIVCRTLNVDADTLIFKNVKEEMKISDLKAEIEELQNKLRELDEENREDY